MPKKVSQAIPFVALQIQVCHAAPQARLKFGGVVPEQVHDKPPACGSEYGPGIVADCGRVPRFRDDGQSEARLDCQAGQSKNDARKHVDDDLLVYTADLACAARAASKDEVAAEHAGHEGVIGACRLVGQLGAFYRYAGRGGKVHRGGRNSPSLPGVGP